MERSIGKRYASVVVNGSLAAFGHEKSILCTICRQEMQGTVCSCRKCFCHESSLRYALWEFFPEENLWWVADFARLGKKCRPEEQRLFLQ